MSIEIQEEIDLKQYTGFNIGGPARYFVIVKSLEEIKQALRFAEAHSLEVLMLGSGTNMLISDKGFNGLVIKIETTGITFQEMEDGNAVRVTALAGQNWDSLVLECVEKKYWGIENLSCIPGTCGAFVVQNVGAYGQDASQVVESVEVFDILGNTVGKLSNIDCYFAYRQSVFNTVFKNRFMVLSVTLRLSKIPKPNLLYADVHRYFDPGCKDPEHDHQILKPEIDQIRKAIIEIRNKKFTLPNIIPNAGSFFKNILLDESEYPILEKHFIQNFSNEAVSKLRSYRNRISANNIIKIPTAFLIDLCGLKGTSVGGAQVNELQPLVIINASKKASSADILQLMQQVRQTVYKKTGIVLEPETELVGFKEEILKKYFKLD
jgi:UDP-N-acetylmuramate dehydrogenase